MKQKAILIGIAGGTGSGKTSLAQVITQDFNKEDVAVIEMDSYYHDQSHIPFEQRTKTNYDHPKAMDFALLKSHLKDLLELKPIAVPVYDYVQHTRSEKTIHFQGQHIIVLDGIMALHDEELRNMMDIKLYVEAPDDIRILRRLKRDIRERGRDFDSVVTQYYETVRPMHIQFIEPTRLKADIIVPEGPRNIVAIDILRTKIKEVLRHK
ncbi:MAG: uridine kinase [Deltaproteobacteria bacterium]|nr:uridine kinase [Deltaproteobacteria bacterium]